jgi:carboxylate-amine ligase
MRICDVCTRLEDAMTITAIYQSLARRLLRLKQQNMKWRIYPAFLIEENRWLAQRFGVSGHLIDLGRGETRPYPDLINELIAFIAEDADALGCLRDVERAREIVARGSSACRQVETFDTAIETGVKKTDAFKAVVDGIVEETTHGL